MRYLRMLSNSVIAAGVASGYLTALVLQLNPSIPIDPATLLPLALVFGVAYGANLTVAFYALIVLRQILAVEVLSPGWLSVRLLSWLCTIAAGAASALMWLNLRGFGDVLDPITRDRMFVGAALVTAAAVLFLGLGLAHLGRRGGRVSAAIAVAHDACSRWRPRSWRAVRAGRRRCRRGRRRRAVEREASRIRLAHPAADV